MIEIDADFDEEVPVPAMSSSDIDPLREIRRMHVLLEDWYGGIRRDLGPFETSLADEFTAVTSDGQLHDRAGYLAALDARRDAIDGPIAIEVEDVVEQRALYGVHQVTFRKRIAHDEGSSVTTCSMWLRETSRTSTGLQWLHLQETPLEVDD